MKKIILLTILLLTQPLAVANLNKDCSVFANFSDHQIVTLQYSYLRGSPYDLGETLAAIAWKESSAGKYIINYKDPSASAYHILAQTGLKYAGIKDTTLNRNYILSKLAVDRNYAADIALWILKDEKRRFKGNRFKMYSAYNGGASWEKKAEHVKARAMNYAFDVRKKVKLLSKCKRYWQF